MCNSNHFTLLNDSQHVNIYNRFSSVRIKPKVYFGRPCPTTVRALVCVTPKEFSLKGLHLSWVQCARRSGAWKMKYTRALVVQLSFDYLQNSFLTKMYSFFSLNLYVKDCERYHKNQPHPCSLLCPPKIPVFITVCNHSGQIFSLPWLFSAAPQRQIRYMDGDAVNRLALTCLWGRDDIWELQWIITLRLVQFELLYAWRRREALWIPLFDVRIL